jgi:hypothetical protein
MDLVKPLFFNAPLEDYDLVTLDYFRNDSAFQFEMKKGEWSLSMSDFYSYIFLFSNTSGI